MLQLLGYSEHPVKYCSVLPSDPGAELLAVTKDPEPLPFPVTPEWCERVRQAIAELDKRLGVTRGGHSRLSTHLKIPTGHLTDLLKGRYATSPLVGPIHEYFGWEPPLPPTASLDAGELVHGYMRMTKAQRALLANAMKVLEGSSGDDAKAALAAMLKAFSPSNDS